MKRILITGGIGAGKSTVAKEFQKLGVNVISVDEVNRELLKKQFVKEKYNEIFGTDVFDGDRLKPHFVGMFYKTPGIKKAIEEFMVLLVIDEVNSLHKKAMKKKSFKYSLIESAQAVELGITQSYDATIVVYTNYEDRVKRVIARDDKTRHEINDIISVQASELERFKVADYIIVNDTYYFGDKDECLKVQVEKIHNKILKTL